jgi:UDP-arabinose 4-epimerase
MKRNGSNRCVLVTGGAGYIGSHACKALAEAGYGPVVYDNLLYGHPWAVKWGPLERGDVADRAALDRVISRYEPEAVMHFAAFTYVGESVLDPGKYYRNNVAGSLTLLEAMRDHGIGKIVFSSTAAVYGLPGEGLISEKTDLSPINPYGASKLMVERMIRDFGRAHGISSVILRYFNAAGADPESGIGEDHDPETHLVPLVLGAGLGGRRKAITVFGDDYDTPDGTCIRDYIHVCDLADAHVKALEYGKGDGIFNLGIGRGFSVKEVIAVAEEVIGRPIPTEIGRRREGDPPRLVADAAAARKALNWEPRFGDLRMIIETAWRWALKREGKGV